MIKIPGYSDYMYLNGDVFIKKSSEKLPKKLKKAANGKKASFYVTMYDDEGERRQVYESKLKSLVGDKLQLPADAKPVYNSNGSYFIDKSGRVYSFSSKTPAGIELRKNKGSHGYHQVRLSYKGNVSKVGVHVLMAETFIKPNYTQEGLVCMHRDNDKTNNNLSNLSVGTYSQNNSDAYRDGLNTGRAGGAS